MKCKHGLLHVEWSGVSRETELDLIPMENPYCSCKLVEGRKTEQRSNSSWVRLRSMPL